MKKILYLTLLLSCLLPTACVKETELDPDDRSRKLIMNSFIHCDSVNNYLYLNLTGPYNYLHVDDATVEVQVNGTTVETIRPEEPDKWYANPQKRFCITSRFHPGDVVRIDAHTTDGKYHTWAEVTVPQPATIVKVDTTITMSQQTGNEYIINTTRYKIAIQDRPQEKNFYRLVIQSHDTVYYKGPDEQKTIIQPWNNSRIFTHEDVVLTDGQPRTSENSDLFTRPDNIYGVFNDYRFANKEYTLNVYTSSYFSEKYYDMNWYTNPDDYPYTEYTYDRFHSDVHVSLISITETEYRYLKLLNVIDSDAFDEILNEPFAFPSNVNGGTGFVGICSQTSVQLKVDCGKSPNQ